MAKQKWVLTENGRQLLESFQNGEVIAPKVVPTPEELLVVHAKELEEKDAEVPAPVKGKSVKKSGKDSDLL
jgi:hypothetical protein